MNGDLFAKVDDPRLEQWRLAEAEGFLPYYRELDGGIGPVISIEGHEMVMLGSNNYLGLTTDPRVRAAAVEAVERYGTGLTGSRLLNGTLDLHRILEEELADWVGQEAALVFSTGYGANLGLISTLVGPGDAAVVDSAAHASIVDGVRLSGGALRAFRHNRPNSLRRTLRSLEGDAAVAGVLVAIDGIYSMEGDWAPVPEIAAACADHGVRLLVDEAHSLGVVGPEGAGTAAATGVAADLIMGTFSKSLASCGGFIAGPRAVVDFLKIACRPLTFTAAGVPAALGAALAATRIARSEEWRREAVVARAAQLHSGLRELGFSVGEPTGSAIVAVHVDDVMEAGLLWQELKANGVYTNCAVPPAVARPVLRTSVMATHSESDIARALEGFARCRVPAPGAALPSLEPTPG